VALSSNPTRIQVEEYLTAAVLVAKGHPLNQAGLGLRNRVVFVFQDQDGEVSSTLEAHAKGDLTVNSLYLVRAVEAIKSAMFRARRDVGEY